jgi:L-ascorbate metabolism protein UlaG (beta-lactamase superfamily)
MATRLRFLGAAGYEIVAPDGRRILIDPFLSQNPAAPVTPDQLDPPDLILVSHAAIDHYGDTAVICKRTGAPVICDTAVMALLLDEGIARDRIQVTTWGIVTEVAGIVVRPVECHHWSLATLTDGRQAVGNPMAFIIEPEEGLRIYHHGDTAFFDQTLIGRQYQPTVGLLGCTLPRELSAMVPGPGRFLTGEMDADEAAQTAEMLGVRVAIASHYLSLEDSEIQRFLQLVRRYDSTGLRQALAPAVGETLIIDGDSRLVERRSAS